jgi:hypothetical protein
MEYDVDQVIEAYDDEKEFYVIDCLCKHSRKKEWAAERKGKDLRKLVVAESTIKYHAIVFVSERDSLVGDLDKLNTTLNCLANQTILPQHITVIRYANDNIQPSKINAILQGYEQYGITWRVQSTLVDTTTNEAAVNLTLKIINFPYYAIFRSGDNISPSLFEIIDHKIDMGLKFAYLTNGDYHGCVIPNIVSYNLQANFQAPLLEKVKEVCPNYVMELEKVCPGRVSTLSPTTTQELT